MRNLTMLGGALVVIGILVLIFNNISYTETKPVLKVGPIHVTTQEERHISIPVIAGVVAVGAGLVLVVAARR